MTLLGYEVIESPNNLNFSRGYLFTFAIPLTHTGGLLSYAFTDWFNMTAGVVLGWDDSKTTTTRSSFTGQFASTPIKDLTANLNWIVGPEQNDNNDNQPRYVLDLVVNYTGFKNIDAGAERRLRLRAGRGLPDLAGDPAEQRRDVVGGGRRTRPTTSRSWFRTGVPAGVLPGRERGADGVRQPGGSTGPTTLTAQFKIWKGLVGRLEYRHDAASEKVYEAKTSRPDASGRVGAVQEPGHDLDQPLLLLLLDRRSRSMRLLRRSALRASCLAPEQPAHATVR